MATIQQNNIDFTNVQNNNIFAAMGKYSISMNDDGTGKFDTSLTGDEITKSFNAVEIDWNGADFSGATAPTSEPGIINTSGDLIKAVKWASTAGPVTSVNGQTGAVSITIPDAPVTSVNGQTGAVTLSIPNAQIQTNTENISNLQTDVASLTNIVSNIFSNLSTE